MISSLVAVLVVSLCEGLVAVCCCRVGALSYLDQNNIGAGFGQGKGHGLANASGSAGDEGGGPAQGEQAHYVGHFEVCN